MWPPQPGNMYWDRRACPQETTHSNSQPGPPGGWDTWDPGQEKNLRHQASKTLPASGQSSHSQSEVQAEKHQHSNVAATQKCHKRRKPSSDWSADSVSETEYALQGFERHPSNPYYFVTNKDKDDPDVSLHPLMITVTLLYPKTDIHLADILTDFQGSRDQIADLNQTLDDLSEKLPQKCRSVAKTSSSTRRSRSPDRSRNKSPNLRHSFHSDDV